MFNKEQMRDVIFRRANKEVPGWYNYFANETKIKYKKDLENLLEKYPDDIQFFAPAEFGSTEHDSNIDSWGVERSYSKNGVGYNVEKIPLEDWSKLDEYLKRVPDPHQKGRFDEAKEKMETSDERYKLGVYWLAMFERLHFVRGMDNVFIDFYTNPTELNRLLDVIEDYLLGTVEEFAKIGLDGVLLGDDWGMQDRLMINPDMWRKWFKPRYKEVFNCIHSFNMETWMHSCGKIDSIIGDLVDIGLDVIHPLQYGCVDWGKVSKEYKGKICFFGGIDVTHTLIHGSTTEIPNHVDTIIKLFGSKSGGLILAPANTIMPETPFENIIALFEAMDRYR